MKHMKRLASLILAAILVLAMSMPVLATETPGNQETETQEAGNHTLTINSKTSGHTFEAYQVFSGTYYEDENILADIEWGTGVNSTTLLSELKGLSAYATCKTAEDVAKIVGGLDAAGLDAFAKVVAGCLTTPTNSCGTPTEGTEYSYEIGNLKDGYYFVKDQDNSLNETDAAYTKFILQINNNATVNAKTDTPTAVKKVKENTKYQTEDSSGYDIGYNDVADYSIGDDVPFLFVSKIPDMSAYKSYQYIFHDQLSLGLTLKPETIKVRIGNDKKGDDTDTELNKNDYIVTEVINQEFSITISDLKSIVERLTEVKKSTTYITIEYDATLNASAQIGIPNNGKENVNEMWLEYSNNPYDEDSKGQTPHDKVIVFTYELDTKKIDGDTKNALADVEFRLYREEGNTKEWVKVNNEGRVTGWAKNEAEGTTLKSGSDGVFKVIGLDHGQYYLKETKELEGYNKLEDVSIVIEAATANGHNWDGAAGNALTALNVKYGDVNGTGDINTGIASGTIENNKGTVLPSTGGIGTTIFYIIGGILVVGAAILLLGKKFAGNQK